MIDDFKIRARLLATQENMQVHAFGCFGEVTGDYTGYFCHACGRSVPSRDVVHPVKGVSRLQYLHDTDQLLARIDELEEAQP